MEFKTLKTIIIKERNLSSNLEKKDKSLKQVSNPKDISLYKINKGQTKTFVSPYALKIKTPEATIKYEGPYKSGDDLLNESKDRNIQIDGWSAKEIMKMRGELCDSMKPETIAALKKLKEKNKNIPKKGITKDEEFLKKVTVECLKEAKENLVLEKDKKDINDLSFIPIIPNKKFLNMDKVEVDKLEWMRQVDCKAESAKSLAIRFHMNGQVMEPDIGMEEDFLKGHEEFDPYLDSLRHHGEEPGREGYTINELFWLARSSFSQQRHIAVTTLINIIQKSKKLQHAHHFNVTTIEQSLVDCGILFLARWLIDDAGLRVNHLEDAFRLLYVVIVNENNDNDKWLLNWPELRISTSNQRLMSKHSSEKDRSRNVLPLSERTDIQDDTLMEEDIISCIVVKTHLFTRLSWLLITNNFTSYNVDLMIIKILQRIAAHSLEMASKLCHDHEELLTRLMRSHLNIKSDLLSPLLHLFRVIANSSQSLAYKITKDKMIISIVFNIISDSNIDLTVHTEAVRLTTVLLTQEVHLGPIVEFTPIILEYYTTNMYNSAAILYIQTIAMFISCLISSTALISSDTYSLISKSVKLSQSYIKCMIMNESNFHITSTIIHLCNTFFHYQFTSGHCSSIDVALEYWTDLLYPIVQSKILPTIYQQISLNTILGYEHSNPNLKLVKLDLHNLLQYSTTLAVQTANPNFVDLKPFFINLHSSVSILSAISHSFQLMIETKITHINFPNFKSAISDLITNKYLIKYLSKISESSYETTVPSLSPYSAIVQLELEAVSQVIMTIAGISAWTDTLLPKVFANIIYKATIRILPHLGPNLLFLVEKLVNSIIFSPTIINVVATLIPPEIKTLLLSQLPSISTLYNEHIYIFKQTMSSQKKLTSTASIDDFSIAQDWIDAPISELYNIAKQSPDALVNTESMMNCLTFIMFLEFDKILLVKQAAIVGLFRLSYLLTSVDWIDTLFINENKLVVSSLLEHYLSDPSRIDINVTYRKALSFYNLYDDLLLKYFYDSFCDTKMANIVMFPCAMRFPTKYRQFLWGQYREHLRFLTLNISESMFPIEEYLSPEEVSDNLLLCYWRAIKGEEITLEKNPLIYWICVHHLNRFIYNQTIGKECNKKNGLMNIQINFANYMLHEATQTKSWISHLQLYKLISSNQPQFYEIIPTCRREHLERICNI